MKSLPLVYLKQCDANKPIINSHHDSNNDNSIKRRFSKKTNPKITIPEILVYKIQPEIIGILSFEDSDYFWLYFIYQNFQNGYFRISLFTIFFEVTFGKWILQRFSLQVFWVC